MRWDAGSKTYGQLHEAMVRRAGVLAWIGLEPGDRLGFALPNGPDYLEIVLAAAHAGVVLVPLDPRLTEAELESRLAHSGCRALVWVRGVRRMLDRDAEPLSADRGLGIAAPWAIAYTSGSTGEPKGAILSHLAKLHSATVEARAYGTDMDSVVLINTPFFHAHALVHAFTALLRGGCVSVARRFDPADTLRVIAEHGVTEISMVPTMYRDLLAAIPFGSAAGLRVVRCTGAALPDDLAVSLRERFETRLHVLYGATKPVASRICALKTRFGASDRWAGRSKASRSRSVKGWYSREAPPSSRATIAGRRIDPASIGSRSETEVTSTLMAFSI